MARLYSDQTPQDAQMSFRLVYDNGYVMLDLVRAGLSGLGILVAGILLYVVPGWALLLWLWPKARLAWGERLGVAAGLSLALYPLLMLWTDLIGVHLGSLYTWLPVILGITGLIWHYRPWCSAVATDPGEPGALVTIR